MSHLEQSRTIVVVGATGNQGSGVVRSLLTSTTASWRVRALTRDPSSAKSQAFLSANQTPDDRLVLVSGHVYDRASLISAFTGAYGVFAVTSEVYPFKVLEKEEEMMHEIDAGRNMVDAAKECGVKHFVFSTLPDMVKTTGGRYPGIHHMNNKHAIEQLARKELDGYTGLIPGYFYTNLAWPQYSQRREDGVVCFVAPIPGGQVTQWTDPTYDMGIFAAKVFELGVPRTKDRNFLVLSPRITADEMASTFTRVTGQPAVHVPNTADEFADMTAPFVGPAFREDAKQMMEWAAVTPTDKVCFGAMDPQDDDSYEVLGVRASTFEDFLLRSGWKGPE
ncbi:hypothetical protein PFICI_09222 [Pestalotiopsis fici W106-1]|uniref:NmrA-like domain-containing protein n=1 Tax=Pestalotiopsis fici (strain W106-1 / CGMCC3.15140) TaxID=1229662 RepID=W3X026_PESFW|nr:uncharacterized protein PFICI_09222 [Pestalotiopsis fici W106-1]ETS79369.1 hypothetical protein PFICI_09222 [Pestalotiopsis fici W106-1]